MFIYFVCIGKIQKNLGKKAKNLLLFHTELQNGLDKMIGTFSKLQEIIVFQACDAPLICI